jgi:integrase
MPGGGQRRESVGSFEELDPYSITDAKVAESKRTVQKKEKRIFDMLPQHHMTFEELSGWYLNLAKVKALASYKTKITYLNKFNSEFGETTVNKIKLVDLENLQEKRKAQGLAPKTIDDEINNAKTMVIKAFKNDLVGGDTLKAFQGVKPMLIKNANARDRILTEQEYESLLANAPNRLKDILTIGYWTGMRKGEILRLTWDKIFFKERVIRLTAQDTKEGRAKSIPISDHVYDMLKASVRHLHDNHVFLYYGRPIKHFSTALKTCCEKAKIVWGRDVEGGFIFHDLRHTFVTDMRKAGVQKSVRMSITGHAPKDMDDRYNRVDDKDRLEAISKLESYRSCKMKLQNVDHFVDQ